MEREPVLAAYASAWTQSSEEGVRRALSACWTESSTYVSPLTDVVHGVEGLTNLILDLPVMFPGASLDPTADPDVHHDVARLPWRMRSTAPIRTLGRDYGHSLDGVDFVEFDDDGRIRRITAFFDDEAPASEVPLEAADTGSWRVLHLDVLVDEPHLVRPAVAGASRNGRTAARQRSH